MLAERPQILNVSVKQADGDTLRKSVTKFDQPEGPLAGGIWHFLIPVMGGTGAVDLPPFWTLARDWVLYQTIYREGQWANAIAKAISKMASKSFEVEGEVPMRVKKAREMLLAFDLNRGWVPGLGKHLQAFLLTGNGGIIEVVHQTGAPGSKVLGLVHLDTFRCIRTGDLDYPIIYRDRKGGEHVLREHQVIPISDMPDQAELWNGVGHCAAERAYSAILRLAAIERYLYDKVSGQRPTSINIVNVPKSQIIDGIAEAKAQREAEGMLTYMGAVVIPVVDPTATPAVATINLTSVPDGFSASEERKNAYLIYANAIGIDPQMLDPSLVASRSLGSGTQSRILSEKQESLGLAAWEKAFSQVINEQALDEKTTFSFREKDLTDQEREAGISLVRAQVIQALMLVQTISGDQALQLLVDWDEVPDNFLPVDQTADTILIDELKPEGDVSGVPDASLLPTGVERALVDNTLSGIQRLIDGAISKSYRLGMKESMDTASMQALVGAVKALAESTDQPPAPIVVNIPEAKAIDPPVINMTVLPTPVVLPPLPVAPPPQILPAPEVHVTFTMPEYETQIVKGKDGRPERAIHRWIPSKEK